MRSYGAENEHKGSIWLLRVELHYQSPHRLKLSKGFHKSYLNLISFMEFTIILNGSKSGQIVPTRGLRQGGPLLPFAFILNVEFFSRLLSKEEVFGNLKGIWISKMLPTISHLLYVDDLMTTCRANNKNAKTMKRIFEL